jgi:hypothetical protein
VSEPETPSAPPTDEHMHFTRMDQGTDADFQVLRRVHERNLAALSEVLFGMLSDLAADSAYNLNRRDHCLQTATRALRDGADEETVVVALFHDVTEPRRSKTTAGASRPALGPRLGTPAPTRTGCR